MKNWLLRRDEQGVVWVNTRRNPTLDSVMRAVTRVGDGPMWVLLTLMLLGMDGKAGILGRQLAVALVINVSLYKILKTLFGRPRPFRRILVVERGARVPDEFSFPSGHMAASCVVAFVLGSAFSLLLFPLIPLSLVIGISRVYLGMHYPSDVLAGSALGILSGMLALAIV